MEWYDDLFDIAERVKGETPDSNIVRRMELFQESLEYSPGGQAEQFRLSELLWRIVGEAAYGLSKPENGTGEQK